MQRAKHADRKKRTRSLILNGAAAERAGADHITPDEIEAGLAHYVETGGEPKLKIFVTKRLSDVSRDHEGGNAASRQSRPVARDNVLLRKGVQ